MPLSLARTDVREAQWRRISVLPELHHAREAGWKYWGARAGTNLELRNDAANAPPAYRWARTRNRCLLKMLHDYSAPPIGYRQSRAARQNRASASRADRTAGLLFEIASKLATPAQEACSRSG